MFILLYGCINFNYEIRRYIASFVLLDKWKRFKVSTDDGTGDKYASRDRYMSEMLDLFTYCSACELMTAAEYFDCHQNILFDRFYFES